MGEEVQCTCVADEVWHWSKWSPVLQWVILFSSREPSHIKAHMCCSHLRELWFVDFIMEHGGETWTTCTWWTTWNMVVRLGLHVHVRTCGESWGGELAFEPK